MEDQNDTLRHWLRAVELAQQERIAATGAVIQQALTRICPSFKLGSSRSRRTVLYGMHGVELEGKCEHGGAAARGYAPTWPEAYYDAGQNLCVVVAIGHDISSEDLEP